VSYRSQYKHALIRRPAKKGRTPIGAAIEHKTIDWLYKKALEQQVSMSHMIDRILTRARLLDEGLDMDSDGAASASGDETRG
jgi:hypothetical protein